MLINTTSDVDKTGQSYYGETHMYFMAPKDGSAISILLGKQDRSVYVGPALPGAAPSKNFRLLLPPPTPLLSFQDKNGPIYDCCWAPNGKEFAIVYGFMPAKGEALTSSSDLLPSSDPYCSHTKIFAPPPLAPSEFCQ